MPSALKPRGSTPRGAVAFEKATQNNRWVSANTVRTKSQFITQTIPKYIINTEMSAGETPLMRDACPIVRGRTFESF